MEIDDTWRSFMVYMMIDGNLGTNFFEKLIKKLYPKIHEDWKEW